MFFTSLRNVHVWQSYSLLNKHTLNHTENGLFQIFHRKFDLNPYYFLYTNQWHFNKLKQSDFIKLPFIFLRIYSHYKMPLLTVLALKEKHAFNTMLNSWSKQSLFTFYSLITNKTMIIIGYWLDMEIILYVRVLVRSNIARRQERNTHTLISNASFSIWHCMVNRSCKVMKFHNNIL